MGKHSAQRTICVTNPAGLHARPSLMVVQTVQKHRSKVDIRLNGTTVSGGDILGLLSLGAACGTELEVTANGPDAEEVIAEITHLFAAEFDQFSADHFQHEPPSEPD